jgi:hypothetical protein
MRCDLVFFKTGSGYTIFNVGFKMFSEIGDCQPIDCKASKRITNSLYGPSDSVSEIALIFLVRFNFTGPTTPAFGF